jgi:hypothetical protein
VNVTLPNGVTIQGVPDNATKDQIRAKAVSAGLAKDEDFQGFEQKKILQDAADELGVTGRALVGAGRGFKDVGEGVVQAGLQAGEATQNNPMLRSALNAFPGGGALSLLSNLVPKGAADKFTQNAQEERALYNQGLGDSTAASAGRFAGNVLPSLVVPGGVAGNALTRAGTAGLAGVATGGLGFVPEDGSRLEQAALGGLFGAGGSAAMSGVGAGLEKLSQLRKPISEIEQLSKQFDVPVTMGEASSSPSLQALETQLERVPGVGIRGFREGQSQALKTAAEKLRGQFDTGGDDVGVTLQKSLGKSFDTARKKATKLYDIVGQASQQAKSMVTPDKTKALAKSIIQDEKAIPALRNAGLIDDLTEFSKLKNMNFDQARKVRSRLLSTVRQAEKKAIQGGMSDEQVRALSRLSDSLEQDIGDFAKREGGSILKSYQRANQFYRENVVPFKERTFRRVLSDDFDTDNILATFIKRDSTLRGRGNQAEKLIGKLDLEGKQAVKYAVLSEAFEKASNSADNVPFSPARFAQEVKKLSDANKVIFDSAEKSQLDGFVKLAEATKRAGQYAENPPTGLRAADLLTGSAIGAGAVASLPMTAAGLGGTKALSLLLTTESGRRILERVNNATVGSKTFKVLTDQANSEIARVVAARASSAARPETKAEEEPRQEKRPQSGSRSQRL